MLNGAPHRVTANTDGDWLLLEADWPGEAQGPEFFWGAIACNGFLDGLAKFVLAGDGSLRLRAEIPVLEGVDLAPRIRGTCSGFEAGWARKGESSVAEASLGEPEPIDLKSLCSEAGWPFAERGGRKLAVELEVPGGFSHAHADPGEARRSHHLRDGDAGRHPGGMPAGGWGVPARRRRLGPHGDARR